MYTTVLIYKNTITTKLWVNQIKSTIQPIKYRYNKKCPTPPPSTTVAASD